ncbi:MAG TPA: hypothetical protein DDY78_22095 [Planctomycetales bacterium]|jgi:pimeloyl-ACP methyl ester carboxylesterase|nr:hypothetical protein [Planctomycetales bacterium]
MNASAAEREELEKSRLRLRESVEQTAAGLKLDLPKGDGRYAISPLRRGARRRLDDPVGLLTLIRTEGGVLTWQEGPAAAPLSGRRGFRRGALPDVSGEVIKRVPYVKVLKLNEVSKHLVDLDKYLNKEAFLEDKAGNLRRWTADNGLQSGSEPPSVDKPSLVFVHGTFSSSDYLVKDLEKIEEATHFRQEAAKVYGPNIFAFDHPTLSVSPVLNALDLARKFAHVKAPVDVICHSRGGLVVRWWLEVIAPDPARRGRVVMVGSPLAGTSLASPANLRASLDFFTNVGHALEMTGTAASLVAPFMAVPVGLLRVINSVLGVGAKTPLIDAVVAMIPGLAGQSRVANNFELNRLRDKSLPMPEYHVIQSQFKPPPVHWWKFWDYFKNNRMAHWGADFLFKEANDLVVDTDSMSDFIEGQTFSPPQVKAFVYDFGQSETVHHTNYFQQKETAEFIIKKVLKARAP